MYSITPFTSKILGATKKKTNNVYIKEKDYLTNEDIVLEISNDMFIEMVSLWLEKKADYCERYNEYCGIFGNFNIEKFEVIGEVNWYNYKEIDDDNYDGYKPIPTPKLVPLIRVLEFDKQCDMEHG
jgi:hypothetical protein